mmetsp:Transcript_31098/g.52717  ORF Transcript_31098/g.52717 Transcript_31098/m.52717 type:complete len:694 (-) Transcript_31098:179-2260(-)
MKAVPLEEENNADVGYECSLDDGAMQRGRHDDDDDGAAEQKTSDDDTFDSSSAVTTTSGSTHGQYKICISKKIMFALLSACVISVGAYVSMKTYYNPSTARDPVKTASASTVAIDGVDMTATMRGDEPVTRQDPPPPSPLDAGNLVGNVCEGEDEKWFKLELITDNAGNETSWELERMGGGNWRLFSVSKPHESMQKYVIRLCIPPADYRFIIRDAGNDGMCCGNGSGSYVGYLREAKIFESPDGDEDWGERVHAFTLPAKTSTTTTTDAPSTSSTKPPISYFPTKGPPATTPPKTSAPTSPMQETTSPALTTDEGGTESFSPSAEEEILSPTLPPSQEPSQVPTVEPSNSPSPNPTTEPTTLPSTMPTAEPTHPPSSMPTAEPTNPPSPLPTPLPTPTPTSRPPPPTPPPTDLPEPSEDTITKIFLIADTPYSDRERSTLMPNHIDQLEKGDFLVHLGDLMFAVRDRCREGAYSIAAEILQKAKMPTFVLPGDNDINDCPSIQHGEDMWMKYFHLFDKKHWSHSFDVTRWGKLNESFGFLHKRVLFLGLNMVGGTPYSWDEKSNRHREHLEQVKALFIEHEGKFDVIVLMKHAFPRYPHQDFFGDGSRDGLFIDLIRGLGKPTIHLHGDHHSYYESEADYGLDNYVRISLVGESAGPPLSVTIDVSKPNPITVSRRQNNLRVNCCADGWPRQ